MNKASALLCQTWSCSIGSTGTRQEKDQLGSTWSEASLLPEMKQGLGDRRLGWLVMPCSGWDMGMTSPAPGEAVAPGTTGQPQTWLIRARAWGQSRGGERLILVGSGDMEALWGDISATRSLSG